MSPEIYCSFGNTRENFLEFSVFIRQIELWKIIRKNYRHCATILINYFRNFLFKILLISVEIISKRCKSRFSKHCESWDQNKNFDQSLQKLHCSNLRILPIRQFRLHFDQNFSKNLEKLDFHPTLHFDILDDCDSCRHLSNLQQLVGHLENDRLYWMLFLLNRPFNLMLLS